MAVNITCDEFPTLEVGDDWNPSNWAIRLNLLAAMKLSQRQQAFFQLGEVGQHRFGKLSTISLILADPTA